MWKGFNLYPPAHQILLNSLIAGDDFLNQHFTVGSFNGKLSRGLFNLYAAVVQAGYFFSGLV